MAEYDWSKDEDGNWSYPSILNLTFENYWPNMYGYIEVNDVVLYGKCRLDVTGRDPPQSLQKHLRQNLYVYLYLYLKSGSTHVVGMQTQSDYSITEKIWPVYSMCYCGTFAGRNVIPLFEPDGDGCIY